MPISDGAIRTFWLSAGGTFHGPKIEHGSITKKDLFAMLRPLLEQSIALHEIRNRCYGYVDERHALWHVANDALACLSSNNKDKT